MQNENNNKNTRTLVILFIILCAGILACGIYLAGYYMGEKKAEKTFQNKQVTAGISPNVTVSGDEKETPTPDVSGSPVPSKANEELSPTMSPGGEPTDTPVETITPEVTESISVTPSVALTPVPTKDVTPTKKPVQTPTVTPKPAVAEKGTPVANHGKLSVNKDGKLVDKNGSLYQLHGVSTHGLQWFPQYVNKAAFQSLRDDWNVNLVRLAMYTAEGGYCEKDANGKAKLKELVNNGVDYATELGMYVIIDWHVLHDQNPNRYTAESIKFFEEMARTYKDHVNVIYEICNEPNGGVTWSQIKTYAEKVIKAIRAIDSDAIIVVGTPTWSQEVDKAAANPITGQKNIMYAIHFYAGTHKEWLIDKMASAAAKKLPIFCTEFGITDASGNGNLDEVSANKWIAKMNELNISYCCWNLANKNESSCLIKSSCNKTSGWTRDEISGQAKWLIKTYGGRLLGGTPSVPEPTKAPGASPTPGPTNTPTPTPAPTRPSDPKPISYEKTVDGYQVGINSSNTWVGAGNSRFYQINVGLGNQTGSDVSSWKLTITFSNEVVLDQCWNCEVTISGKTMVVTPLSYSGSIDNGGSRSDIGIIFSSASEVTINSVSCK